MTTSASSFFSLALLTAALLTLSAAHDGDHKDYGDKGECAPCGYDAQCEQGHCYRRKCTSMTRDSLKKCFPYMRNDCGKCRANRNCYSQHCINGKCIDPHHPDDCFHGECHECSKSNQCGIGQKCFNSRCVFNTRNSKEKCFKSKVPVCEYCTSNRQCASGECYKSKCVHPKRGSRNLCFLGECYDCKYDQECESNICSRGRCIYNTPLSTQRCFPKFAGECDACRKKRDCGIGSCYKRKCIPDIKDGYKKCALPECARCSYNKNCDSNICYDGKCIYDTFQSKKECFPTGAEKCEKCDIRSDCKDGMFCIQHKCMYDTKSAREDCLYGECGDCYHDDDCLSRNCYGAKDTKPGKCIYGVRSMPKCFKPRGYECAPCGSDAGCESDVCYDGQCVNGSYEASKHCFKTKECKYCTFDRECELGLCLSKMCTDGSRESRVKCQIGAANCEACRTRGDCLSGSCHKHVCGTAADVAKCGKKECSKCKFNWDCTKGQCKYGKCSDGLYTSLVNCGFIKRCDHCHKNEECATGYCKRKRCVHLFETRKVCKRS